MMKKLMLVLLVVSAAVAAQAGIAVTGFDHDWIHGSSETFGDNDAGPATFMWYATDSGVTATYPGLAASGALTVAGEDFQLESYTAKNVLYAGKTYAANDISDTQNTLTLVTPGSFSEISVLGASFPGDGTMTINFEGGGKHRPHRNQLCRLDRSG